MTKRLAAGLSPSLLAMVVIASADGRFASGAQAAQPAMSSFAEVAARFADPPAEYRTVPFWVWNDRVTRELIDRDLGDLKRQGVGGVLLHPRYGLVTDYLSAEWFDLVKYAVEKAKALGIQVWLYDENSFPSGFAGGHVPAEMPESYAEPQGLRPRKVSVLTPEILSRSEVVLRREGKAYAVVPAAGPFPPGDYVVFEHVRRGRSKWYAGYSYVDLIRDGVTQKFIDVTMRGYEKAVGADLGGAVPGIFTDEPSVEAPERGTMRWTPALFDRFLAARGYDLRPHLPALFEETGDWRQIRHDLFLTLHELFVERWAKPWSRYCEERGFAWTGHYWDHEWPDPGRVPDNMAMAAWHQVPGIDLLFNQFDEEKSDQFGDVRIVRELASVANQLARRRTLSETYGAGGWELRFADMKRLGDWEYVLGVNLMNQHLTFMSLAGDRKHDFPQSFSYHAPWWPHYRVLADYFGRLSLALSSGVQRNRVLVIEPTTTGWMYGSYAEKDHPRLAELELEFRSFLLALERRQVEYDLGSEDMLRRHGRAEGGHLTVGKAAYEVVVLPPGTESLEKETLGLLSPYLASGGQVVSFVPVPRRVSAFESGVAQELAARHPAAWRTASALDDQEALALLAPVGLRFEVRGEPARLLYHQRRRLADGELVFLVNSSLESRSSGEFSIRGRSVTELDAMTGRTVPRFAETSAQGLRIAFDLPPAGSLLLFVHEAASGTAAPRPAPAREKVVAAAGPLAVRRLAPNAAPLDYCDLVVAGKELKGLFYYQASDRIFKSHGFADNPWANSSQYRTELLDLDRFSPKSGFEARFHFEVDSSLDPRGIVAVVERPGLWKVAINGQEVGPTPGEWWLDRAFGVFAIGSRIRQGENVLAISISPMSIHAELAPPILLGEFAVVRADRGFRLAQAVPLRLGPWKDQGLPFYPQTVSYGQNVRLEKGKRYAVRLGGWEGSVAEVRKDSQAVGIVGWPPYEADLAPPEVSGEALVEVVVYGSLKNLLGPHHNVRQRGLVTPWSFKFAPEAQPPLEQYDTLGYGLTEPFTIIERQ
jgi:hypothetical protein